VERVVQFAIGNNTCQRYQKPCYGRAEPFSSVPRPKADIEADISADIASIENLIRL
jgi:hypothetical protein